MEIRLSGHSAYRTEYHLVWIPKYRRRILNPGVKGYLHRIFPKVMRSLPGCEIIGYSIQADHVHMVMIVPPRYAVSDVLQRIRGATSKMLRDKFHWLHNVYRGESVLWSPGYFVSTVGIDEKRIIAYVEWQERQDLGQAQLELF